MRQPIESSGLIAARILLCEVLAALDTDSGDDDGTTGTVDLRVVIPTNPVAGGFDPAEDGFSVSQHDSSLTRPSPPDVCSAVVAGRLPLRLQPP
jgi:hypothetical protein